MGGTFSSRGCSAAHRLENVALIYTFSFTNPNCKRNKLPSGYRALAIILKVLPSESQKKFAVSICGFGYFVDHGRALLTLLIRS